MEQSARIPESKDPIIREPNIEVPIWVGEVEYKGMLALIHWLDGFESAGKGKVPGHHELVMFFRTLTAAIHKGTK